jgi:hypothetical protein
MASRFTVSPSPPSFFAYVDGTGHFLLPRLFVMRAPFGSLEAPNRAMPFRKFRSVLRVNAALPRPHSAMILCFRRAQVMSVHRILGLAFVVAIIFVARKIAYPSGSALSYRIFDGFYWLSVSYVPSYFVYLLVVYLPRRRAQKNLSVFVANRTAMLVGDGEAIYSELSKAANHTSIATPSADDFKTICGQIHPAANSPLLRRIQPLEYANWIEFLLERKARSERAIDLLLRYMLYLEPGHVRLITEIKDCVLFMMLDGVARLPFGNQDMSFFSSALFGYYNLTRELAAYSDKHMRGVAWSKRRQ